MTNGILCLGKGRLSGACLIGNENVIIIKRGGALYKKRLLPGKKIVDDGIVSYADDCYLFPIGKLENDTEVRFEIQRQ